MSTGFARRRRRLVPALLLLATTAWLAGPAAADIDPAKLPAAKSAAASFLALAKGSETSGQVPRENDPATRPLLDVVFDARDIEAGRTIAVQELTPLNERMVTGAQVGTAYMLAGTGAADLGTLAQDPQADEKVNRRVIRFAPEMGRFLDFQLRIQGAIIEAVLARMASARPPEAATPTFQSGIAQIRQGSLRTVASVIETMAVDGLSDDWRRARLPALTAVGLQFARFLQPDQKAELQKLAVACADVMNDARVKQDLQAFAQMIAGG
jgi:hypothetical protein